LLLPSHGNWNINYYCTSVNSSNATSYPTIWFESSIEHGIVDFFGLQIIIAQNYSRNSCSYDPPNFGWSSRLPADLPWDYDFFPYLLSALNRTNEDRVFVGWGTGNQFAIRHAIANPNTTKGLVMIDPEPMGIDALVQRGPANWTNQHLQLVYGNIMTQKISSVRISLSWLFVG
jgi:pimeloyl-ACP methyl ester carboxylesterase